MNYLKMGAVIMTLFLASNCSFAQTLSTTNKVNTLKLERNPYGFIFTTIEINGQSVKALIDFGDPSQLQLSGSFVEQQHIPLEATGEMMMHIDGSTFSVNKGVADTLSIGEWKYDKLEFRSSPGEIEFVAEQIGTSFNAVLGWGYFSQYYTLMNYAQNYFELSTDKPAIDEVLYEQAYLKNSNYLSLAIDLGKAQGNFILDTGSTDSFIDSTYVQDLKLQNLNLKVGAAELPLQLQVQDLRVLRPIEAVGIIGADFLSSYEILLDPFEKHLIFASKK